MTTSGATKDPKTSTKFKGPILFINHDAQNLKASPHRHQVFTHVQNNYRRWKRREDAKLIRSGAKLPPVAPATPSRPGRKVEDTVSLSSQTSSDRFSFATTPQSSLSSSADDDSEETQIVNAAIERAAAPLSMSRDGNSDPFNGFPFKLDAQANELIAFYRDRVIPSIYHTGSGRKSVTEASALRDFNDTIQGLQDEGGAYSFLAKNAFTASHSNPAMRQIAAVYQGKSTKLLMDKVAKGTGSLQSQNTLWHINNAWQAETIDENLAGSIAHGKMLRYLFDEQAKLGKLDFKYLLYVIYTDCHMSATFLIRPVFDVEVWLPKVLAPIWKQAAAVAAAYLPPLPDTLNQLDPSVDDPTLQHVFVDRRETAYLFISSATQKQEIPQSTLVLAWIAYRAIVSQGRMITFFLEKKGRLVAPNLTEEAKDSLYAYQYTALAALYITRHWSFSNSILGEPMFRAAPKILAALREVLEQSDRWPGGPSFHKYNNARLWALYVGAVGEQVLGKQSSGSAFSEMWFHRKMAEQAYVLDVTTWDAAKTIFMGFLYTELIPPNGKDWFEKTLTAVGPLE